MLVSPTSSLSSLHRLEISARLAAGLQSKGFTQARNWRASPRREIRRQSRDRERAEMFRDAACEWDLASVFSSRKVVSWRRSSSWIGFSSCERISVSLEEEQAKGLVALPRRKYRANSLCISPSSTIPQCSGSRCLPFSWFRVCVLVLFERPRLWYFKGMLLLYLRVFETYLSCNLSWRALCLWICRPNVNNWLPPKFS